MLNKEIWKDIPNYEGLYQVSNKGRIKSLERNVYDNDKLISHKSEKILAINYIGNNRGTVRLSKNGKSSGYIVSRLVAQAFIPNPENKPCVDHWNTDYTDNRVNNLSWVTNKENQNNPFTLLHMSKGQKGHPYYGRTISEEERKATSERFKGKPLSEAHKKKLSEIHKGKKQSKESIEKMLLNHHKSGIIHLQEDENGFLIYKNGLIDPSKYE